VPAAGVPLNFAVPFPLFTNVTPEGNAPDSVIVGAGVPAVVMVNVPAVPTLKAVLAALVIAGFAVREGVNAWRGDACCVPVGRYEDGDEACSADCDCCHPGSKDGV